LNPFSLLGNIQENLPNWLDQLPQLPILILNAIAEASQQSELRESLEALRRQQEQEQKQRRSRARVGAYLALGLSVLTLVPAIGASISSAPIATLGLAGLGAYLLFFR
jgi:membrane protein required for beta-lactamase induction